MSKEKQTVNGDVGNVVSGDVTIHNYSADILPLPSNQFRCCKNAIYTD